MPRITQAAFLKSLWRRYPGTILFHLGLLLFLLATLWKYGDFSFITSAGKQNERRDLEFKKYELYVDPSMPLDRVVDEELAEWIEQLLVKKPADTDGEDRALGEKISESKAGDEMNGNVFKKAMESVEVLGEGGSPRDRPSVRMAQRHIPNVPPAKRVNVLIVAAMRTGSSFLGELFQQRRDFFYMFEPGMQIMHKLDSANLTRRVIYTKLIDMLNGFYRCKFNDISFFIDELNHRTLHGRQQSVAALVTSQFCRKTRKPGYRSHQLVCDPVSEKVLETACATRDHTAVKSIRVLDINLMISAVKDPDMNLKLIHLIRDPRSMILSRLKLKFPAIKVFNVTELSDTYRNILLKYCSNWLQNYEIGHYVPLMKKNYLMVRYEDLALEPYVYAKRIYDFVGLGAVIPPAIQTWIDINTNINDPSQKRAAAFSTRRDSKEVLVSWKSRLTLEMANAIEGVGDCTRLMKATGYKLIGKDYVMLKNNDHLVDEFPLPEFHSNEFDFM